MSQISIAAPQLSRRSFLRTVALAAVAGATPLRAGPENAVGLSEIIRRNTLARGGAAALDRIRALQIDAEIVEGGNTINGRWTATPQGRVRVDIYVGGESAFSEGVDEAGAWMWEGGTKPPAPSVDAGRAALLNGAENHLIGWHRFAERGNRLKLMPETVIDGAQLFVVEVTYATGQVSYFYVDPVTWHTVRRRDERAYHPDVDPTKKRVESRFFDFQAVDGVVASHRSTDIDLATGKTLANDRVIARRVNPDLASNHFDRARRAAATW